MSNAETMNRLRSSLASSFAALFLVGALGLAPPVQDADTQPAERDRTTSVEAIKAEAEALSETLRAAVYSGTLSEEDARRMYRVLIESIKTQWAAEHGAAAKSVDGARDGSSASPKESVLRLAPPRPAEVTTLFLPDFLSRDLAWLRDALELDDVQVTILTLMIADYVEAIELAEAPLRQAMARYQRAAREAWIADALRRSDDGLAEAIRHVENADADVVVERTQRALNRVMREKEADGPLDDCDE